MLTFTYKVKRFAAVGLACTLLLAVSAQASVADELDFPSWEEIQAAKGDAQATQDQIDSIEQLLSQLNSEAAELGDAATRLGAQSQSATQASKKSKATLDALNQRKDLATKRSQQADQELGQIAATMYKAQGATSDVALMLSDDPETALRKLSLMDNLSKNNARKVQASVQERNTATDFAQQAKDAQNQYDRDVAAASAAEQAAAEKAQQADNRVQEQQQRSKELYAQLAALKGTTAELESKRIRGLEAQAAYEQQQRDAKEARDRDPNKNKPADPAPQPPAPHPPVPQPPVPEPPQPPAPEPPAPEPPAPEPPAPGPPGEIDDPSGAQAYASATLGNFGWGQDQMQCLVNLWNKESGWRTTAMNPSSGAYGIPQSLPGSKMASAGADWRTNYRTQVDWGLGYIKERYGTPCAAWQHSIDNNWY